MLNPLPERSFIDYLYPCTLFEDTPLSEYDPLSKFDSSSDKVEANKSFLDLPV